jgi:hypothetical protein
MLRTFTDDELAIHHKRSFANEPLLKTAKDCGCFSCLEHCDPDDVDLWDDSPANTAVCPHCGIDSIITEHETDRVDDELLKCLQARYF